MSYFQSLKDSITCRDAAEQYGLEVNAAGMARCPFHEDRHPSLKLGVPLLRLRCPRGCDQLRIPVVWDLRRRCCPEAGQELRNPGPLERPSCASCAGFCFGSGTVGHIRKNSPAPLLRHAGDMEAGTAACITGSILASAVCGSLAAAG